MSKRSLENFRDHNVTVRHLSEPVTLVQAHVDPKYGDIVINGYGVKRAHAKGLRDWLTQALRKARR